MGRSAQRIAAILARWFLSRTTYSHSRARAWDGVTRSEIDAYETVTPDREVQGRAPCRGTRSKADSSHRFGIAERREQVRDDHSPDTVTRLWAPQKLGRYDGPRGVDPCANHLAGLLALGAHDELDPEVGERRRPIRPTYRHRAGARLQRVEKGAGQEPASPPAIGTRDAQIGWMSGQGADRSCKGSTSICTLEVRPRRRALGRRHVGCRTSLHVSADGPGHHARGRIRGGHDEADTADQAEKATHSQAPGRSEWLEAETCGLGRRASSD